MVYTDWIIIVLLAGILFVLISIGRIIANQSAIADEDILGLSERLDEQIRLSETISNGIGYPHIASPKDAEGGTLKYDLFGIKLRIPEGLNSLNKIEDKTDHIRNICSRDRVAKND